MTATDDVERGDYRVKPPARPSGTAAIPRSNMIDGPSPIRPKSGAAHELVSRLEPPQSSDLNIPVCDGEIGYQPVFPLMPPRAVRVPGISDTHHGVDNPRDAMSRETGTMVEASHNDR